ncbi:MAG: cytochrome c [Bacteroidetes bacterium]|jgi:mono/diheme cytochrome c family protein|nr:cytochrome c [Bacteroidota bacterium]
MLNMKNNILKLGAILGVSTVLLNSCGPKDNPPLVYFPDMYFPVAYDPLQKAEDAYSKHENTIPAFVANDGATGMISVDGTVAQNKDGVVEVNSTKSMKADEYNAGYDAAKLISTSPLNVANQAADLERGKKLFNQVCAVCHGEGGDGQGPIVQSGAYSGVPNYKDRQVTVGSVHYVLTNGRNAMGSYAGQLNPGDRWRVAMYVMSAFKGGISATPATETTAVATASTTTASATTTPATGKENVKPTTK